MALPSAIAHRLETLARDLDLVVYRLEQPSREPERERDRVRRELERLKDQLEDLVRVHGV